MILTDLFGHAYTDVDVGHDLARFALMHDFNEIWGCTAPSSVTCDRIHAAVELDDIGLGKKLLQAFESVFKRYECMIPIFGWILISLDRRIAIGQVESAAINAMPEQVIDGRDTVPLAFGQGAGNNFDFWGHGTGKVCL